MCRLSLAPADPRGTPNPKKAGDVMTPRHPRKHLSALGADLNIVELPSGRDELEVTVSSDCRPSHGVKWRRTIEGESAPGEYGFYGWSFKLTRVALWLGRWIAVPLLGISEVLMGFMRHHAVGLAIPGAYSAMGFAGTSFAGLVFVLFLLNQLESQLAAQIQSNRSLREEQEKRAEAESNLLAIRAQLEDAQRFKAIGRVASGVAHEFNNLLQILTAWTEVLEQDSTHEDQTEAVEQIRLTTQEAGEITSALLSVARKSALERSPMELHERISQWAVSWQLLLPDTIQLTVEANPAGWCMANESALQQALLNLIRNASDEAVGSTAIHVRVSSTEHSDLPIHIAIVDNGRGIGETQLERVFEPFYTSKGARGTGLGLAIVRGTIEQYGGRIAIRSTLGVGTEIDIRLPRTDNRPKESNQDPPSAPSARTLRILVVEDESVVRDAVQRMLLDCGHHCETRPDGDAALALLRENPVFDLLCVDAHMPGAPVTDIIAQLRQMQPEARVLVCSGNIQDPLLLDTIQREGLPVLSKPFSRSDLYREIDALFATA